MKSSTPAIAVASLLILLLSFPSQSKAQIRYSTEAEQEFSSALAMYKRGNFADAAGAFHLLAKAEPMHHRSTAALVMAAKAELYGGMTPEAEQTVYAFLQLYPSSSFTADARYTLALAKIKRREFGDAVDELLLAFRQSVSLGANPVLQQSIVSALDEVIETSIELPELRRLAILSNDATESEYLEIKVAEKLLAVGDVEEARQAVETLRSRFPKPAFGERLKRIESRLNEPRTFKVGVLLPLMKKFEQSGREKEIGVGLYEGISLALDDYDKESLRNKPKITLDVRDNERENAIVTSQARSMANDRSVLCIIGPAFSSAAFAASVVANESRIPLITPTANANGIAATGEYVFQASPDLETRARAMAIHAVRNMRLRRLAVLSSTEQSSKILAEAFIAEAERLGAIVVTTEWYDRGTTDLGKQLTNIRRKGNTVAQEPYLVFSDRFAQAEAGKLLALGFPKKVLDSLVALRSVANAIPFLGEDARTRLDEQRIPYVVGDPRIDSLQHITTAVQGLYCPIAVPSEIGIIASQLAYYGIRTQLLGSGEWNNPSDLNANRLYTKDVQFESDVLFEVRSTKYALFSTKFAQMFNRYPNRYNVIGYDTAKMILQLIARGATSREQMRDALASARSVETIHSKIGFATNRVNSWLHILQYDNGDIRPVTEVLVEAE